MVSFTLSDEEFEKYFEFYKTYYKLNCSTTMYFRTIYGFSFSLKQLKRIISWTLNKTANNAERDDRLRCLFDIMTYKNYINKKQLSYLADKLSDHVNCMFCSLTAPTISDAYIAIILRLFMLIPEESKHCFDRINFRKSDLINIFEYAYCSCCLVDFTFLYRDYDNAYLVNKIADYYNLRSSFSVNPEKYHVPDKLVDEGGDYYE